jgi:Na+/proline symporter
VAVGVYKIRSVKNSEDFMVAGRTLPWYILVGTLLATWMGSGSLFSGAGYKSIIWSGKNALGENVGAGVYFYLIQAGDFRKVRKMVLLK